MDTLISLIGAPANALTLLIAAGVLFFQLVDRGYLKVGKPQSEQTPAWAEELMAYYNHDTTEHQEQAERKLDLIVSITRDSHSLLKDFDKHGITCRTK